MFDDSYTNPPRGGPSIDAIPRNNTNNPNVDVRESIPNKSTRTIMVGMETGLKIVNNELFHITARAQLISIFLRLLIVINHLCTY